MLKCIFKYKSLRHFCFIFLNIFNSLLQLAAGVFPGIFLLLFPSISAAFTTTWSGAVSNAWANGGNWSGGVSPGLSPSPFDTAIFPGATVRVAPNNAATITLNTIQYNNAATVYTITNAAAGNMTLDRTGIVNNSSVTQLITNNGILSFNSASDAGSNIAITSAAGSTLNFNGSSTATNAALTVNGTGNINISGLTTGITFGSLSGTGNVNLGTKTLQVGNLNTDTTFSGIISGTGAQLTKIGTGTLTLSGANSYGSTTVSAGTLQVGAGGGVGSLTGNIGDNAALVFNRTGTLTHAGDISGTGTLTKLGGGTVILTGNVAHTGGTTISAGTLQIGDGVTTGSISGNIVDNAALSFNPVSTGTYAGNLSGTGTLTKLGTGTLKLTGDTTISGATTISGGTLQIGDAGTTGSVSGDIAITSTNSLIFNRSNSYTYGGGISGGNAGNSVTQAGTGTLIFTNANTYAGSTIISAGTLQIGNGGVTGSVTGAITDNAALVFNRSDNPVYAGAITGTGTLAQNGSGTLILTGANNFSGGTTISTGALQIGNGGATGSITGDILNNSAFITNRTGANTYAGNMSGIGSFSKIGSSTLTITGNLTHTGGTTISAGTLQIGNGGTTGDITGNITDNATLSFNRSGTGTYAGDISGTGAITKIGTSTLTFTGNTTISGSTTISAGILQIGNGGTTGSITGNIIDNAAGSLVINRSNSFTYGGVLSGGGAFTQAGSGTTILTNTNTHTGTKTISAGTLQIGDGGVTGSITGNVTNNSALVFNRSDSITYGNVISSTGTLTQNGSGTLILTGNNTFSGDTTIASGTLQLGNNTTAGAVTNSNIINNSALTFFRSNAITYAGNISGTGTMTKLGAGTLTLTGTNTFSGATTITTGTLSIGNGGTTGSIGGNIVDDAALTFNRSNSLTYAGMISGTGTVTKSGTGTVILNGNNSYTGLTTVNAGTLLIGDGNGRGSIASSATVNAAGTLGGYGTINNNVINGGNVTPGNSIGTLHITGDYTQTAAGTYTVEIDSVGASDLLSVTGTATLDGNLSVVPSGGFQTANPYTILTAGGGVVGTFSNTNAGELQEGFLQGTVVYLPNAVQLFFNFNSAVILADALTPNQRAVANYLVAVSTSPGIVPGAVADLFTDITTGDELRQALDQISGATFANQTMELGRTVYGSGFEDELADRYIEFPNCEDNTVSIRKDSLGNQQEYCNQDKTFWILAEGARDGLSSTQVSGLNTSRQGVSMGFEDPLDDQAAVGAAMSINRFDSIATAPEIGDAKGDLFQFGLYGRYQKSRWLFGGSVDGGVTDGVNATRTISVANVTIPSTYYGSVIAEQARVSYSLWHDMLRPFLGIFNQNVNRGKFNEMGSTGFELQVNSGLYHSFRSQLGVMLEVPTKYTVKPFASLAWEHEFLDDYSTFDAQLIAVGGSNYFHIEGSHAGKDIGILKAGLAMIKYRGFNLYGLYAGQLAQHWHENGGRVVAEIRF